MRYILIPLLVIFASTAQAEPMDDLKSAFRSCLLKNKPKFPKLNAGTLQAWAWLIIDQCSDQKNDLDFADKSRTKTDMPMSESAAQVIEDVFGSENRQHILKSRN